MRKPAAVISVAMHVLVVMLLLTITVRAPTRKAPARQVLMLAPLRPFLKRGGGGQSDPLPAMRGRAPTVVAPRPFVPPAIVRNQNPKLAIEPALLEAPQIKVDSETFGDPLSKAGIPSGGPGRFGGFGDGDHGGIGPGSGPREGAREDAAIRAAAPKLTRQPRSSTRKSPNIQTKPARHIGREPSFWRSTSIPRAIPPTSACCDASVSVSMRRPWPPWRAGNSGPPSRAIVR